LEDIITSVLVDGAEVSLKLHSVLAELLFRRMSPQLNIHSILTEILHEDVMG